MVMPEEMADDGENWGKTAARTHGLATQKESCNGVVEHRLAGGECGGVLP
jgi:hypothetical protein